VSVNTDALFVFEALLLKIDISVKKNGTNNKIIRKNVINQKINSMRKILIVGLITLFCSTIYGQSSESTLPYRFVKKEIKGFLKMKPDQIKKSYYNRGLSLCKKYNYSEDNELSAGQSIDGNMLFRFTSSNNEETAIITDSTGRMIEVIAYLNEELKPYNSIVDQITEKEYDIYGNSGEYGAAAKYITPNESWIEVYAKRKGESKSPILILFFDTKLKFLREEEKE